MSFGWWLCVMIIKNETLNLCFTVVLMSFRLIGGCFIAVGGIIIFWGIHIMFLIYGVILMHCSRSLILWMNWDFVDDFFSVHCSLVTICCNLIGGYFFHFSSLWSVFRIFSAFILTPTFWRLLSYWNFIFPLSIIDYTRFLCLF